MQSAIEIRKCAGTDEFIACVSLQKEVWQFQDAELIPDGMFIVADHVGGQVIGAFAGGELVGYVLAVPGVRDRQPYLHSHMLAVRKSYRDRGVGHALKLAQRQDAVERGFNLIEWTFDPLEIKNAWLNMVKLGAIARQYHLNFYGQTSSFLHLGLPTDRLLVEWWVRSKRVVDLLDHGQTPAFDPLKKINVPAEIYQWRASAADLPKAAEVQKRNREEFERAFAQNLAVLGYERDAAGNGTFLLGEYSDNLIAG